jgi:pimeloyl-ACP methyl ester carboxylesterase
MTALRDAGVRPGDPVLLVGHSQGGMVAAAVAAHASPYDVTNVVTFGSPTAQVAHYPGDVHVLSLEHRGDLVPQLAGPDTGSAHHVTVQFASGVGGLEDNHSYLHYTAGAAAVDASTDPDVASSRHSLAGFLAGGDHVRSQVFQLTRDRG